MGAAWIKKSSMTPAQLRVPWPRRICRHGGWPQLAFGETFKVESSDVLQPFGVHLLDDALFDEFFIHLVVRIHIANHFLQLIRWEYVAQDIEHFASALGIEVIFDGLDALGTVCAARDLRAC